MCLVNINLYYSDILFWKYEIFSVNVCVEFIVYIGLPIIFSILIVYVEHKLETYME